MGLNTRPSMDPRFAFHHRAAASGRMHAQVMLFQIQNDPETMTNHWDVWNPDPELRQPKSPNREILVYRGPAAVQPNKDWRARQYRMDSQTDTTNAVRFQLDFALNEIKEPPEGVQPIAIDGLAWFPAAQPNDRIAVVSVLTSPGGVEVDPQLKMLDYRVRNVSMSSNSWVRDILCDVSISGIGGPYLGNQEV